MKFTDVIKVIIWIISFEAIGYFLGNITQSNLAWYSELSKSILTPPGIVFSIVWPSLYAILAIVGWYLWGARQNSKIRSVRILYFIQLIINWAWTPVFFQFHYLGLGFLLIILMVFLNAIIFVRARIIKPLVALAIFPYLLWLMFASYLNGMIWALN